MLDIAAPADIEEGFEDGEEEPNMVRIGKKPIMNYVVACMTLLNTGVADVMVRGRGQSITKAVEVVDMLRRAFMKNIRIHSVDIGTEEVKRELRAAMDASSRMLTATSSSTSTPDLFVWRSVIPIRGLSQRSRNRLRSSSIIHGPISITRRLSRYPRSSSRLLLAILGKRCF